VKVTVVEAGTFMLASDVIPHAEETQY